MIGKLSSECVPLKYMLARTASVGISNLTFPSIRCHCCTAWNTSRRNSPASSNAVTVTGILRHKMKDAYGTSPLPSPL